MGVPKHGATSAHAKSCKKYKDANHHAINKQRIADRIAAGKKIKPHKQPKTSDMRWNTLIRNTVRENPYVTSSGSVMWGTSTTEGKNGKGSK